MKGEDGDRLIVLVGGRDEGLELRWVSIVLCVGRRVEWMDIRTVGWHGNYPVPSMDVTRRGDRWDFRVWCSSEGI